MTRSIEVPLTLEGERKVTVVEKFNDFMQVIFEFLGGWTYVILPRNSEQLKKLLGEKVDGGFLVHMSPFGNKGDVLLKWGHMPSWWRFALRTTCEWLAVGLLAAITCIEWWLL